MNYLVSYQHSGNTWLRYCIEYLTKLPTHGHRAFSISERNNNFLGVDLNSEPEFMKRHEVDFKEMNVVDDVFILLLRQPNQCIKASQDAHKEFLRYYALIRAYKRWKGVKKIIYFDNIMDSYFRLMDVLKYCRVEWDVERERDLKKNWDKHKAISLSLYNNHTKEEGADLSTIPQILLDEVKLYFPF